MPGTLQAVRDAFGRRGQLGLGRGFVPKLSQAFVDLMDSPSSRSLERFALAGLREYASCVGQVIFEMAFAAAMCVDKDQQPLGGPQVFFAAMTLSVLTSGIIGHIGSHSARLLRPYHPKVCVALQAISLALSLSQVVMRYPVLMANRA